MIINFVLFINYQNLWNGGKIIITIIISHECDELLIKIFLFWLFETLNYCQSCFQICHELKS